MTFEEMLDQAVTMLRRRGRVRYRALKAHFQLGDDLLEALKDALLSSYPVIDQQGRGLVWIGDLATPVPASPASAPPGVLPQFRLMPH